MKKIISFLQWEFQGCTRSASFWGCLISMLGVVMMFGGCPQPYPIATVGAGLLITFGDIFYSLIRLRIKLYQLDQETVARRLGEK
jgi:hypothetical protein